jgi:AraC-like DNA-binding protein
MTGMPDIRSFFQPVQPAADSIAGVSYKERLPHPDLSKFIYCYWQLRTNESVDQDFYYRVVADGCIDIFMDLQTPGDNFIMGLSTAYTKFDLGTRFNYTGIRFLPAAFPLLYNLNASELTNRCEHLKDVLPAVSDMLTRLVTASSSMQDMARACDSYFLRTWYPQHVTADCRLFNALELLVRNKSINSIESGMNTGLSPRQLRRLFHFYIGESPKTFSRIARFQQLLRAKPSVQSLKSDKIFYDAGYYDQAHFIKEFKTFSGLTPVKVFAS